MASLARAEWRKEGEGRLKPIHLVSEITYNRRTAALPANLHHTIGRTADRKTP